MSELEVDNFGRTLPKRKYEDDRPARPQARPDTTYTKDRRTSYPPRDEYSSRDSHRRSNQNSESDYKSRRNTSSRGRSSSPSSYRSRKIAALGPMMSFKAFMHVQEEELTPEQFQRKYDEYQFQYTVDFSNHFFESNKCEEWFRERYDPTLLVQSEQDVKMWSAAESKRIADIVNQSPESSAEYVQSCRLNIDDRKEIQANINTNAGHQMTGHQQALYITGIPAACTRSFLTTSINSAFTAVPGLDPPQRVLVSSPMWFERGGSKQALERSAWVILSSITSTEAGIRALRDLKVDLLGPINPLSGEFPKEGHFSLQVFLHSPRPAQVLPDFMNGQTRVEFDFARALEIASLLDAVRGIPEEQSLKALLSVLEKDSALSRSALMDKLDVTLAYLRRVHLVMYYIGKRFRDESQLLSQSPSVVNRSALKPRSEGEGGGRGKEGEAWGGERADDGEEAVKSSGDGGAYAVQESKQVLDVDVCAPYDGYLNSYFLGIDTANSSLIGELRGRIADASNHTLSSDANDVATIERAMDRLMDHITQENCVMQPDSKARCGLIWCNKLFKGREFLKKHLQSKHADVFHERLVRVSEPFMKQRFDNEDISQRPLPLVEVGPVGSGTDSLLRSAKEVRESVETKLSGSTRHSTSGGFRGGRGGGRANTEGYGAGGGRGGSHNRDRDVGREGGRGRDSFGGGGGSHRRESRDGDDRRFDRRDDRPASRPSQFNGDKGRDAAPVSMGAGGGEESKDKRMMASYKDVDTPADSVLNLDYGGVAVLPPMKRRKLVIKQAEPTVS